MGKDETVRWMNLTIYQGAPAKKGLTTAVSDLFFQICIWLVDTFDDQAAAASANPLLAEKAARDPTLICTGYKRQRFYLFTRSEPEYACQPLL